MSDRKSANWRGRLPRILAACQVLVGCILVAAFFATWLQISYVNSTATAAISWATYLRTDFNASQSVPVDLMPLGALAAVLAGIVGLLGRGRRSSTAGIVAFLVSAAGVGVLWSELNSGALYPTDFAVINPGPGMFVFAIGAVAGLVASALDTALRG